MADSVIVRIDGDDKGFKTVLSGIGNTAKKSLSVVAAGVAASTAGVTALTGFAVKGFKEYEQLIGGVDTLFKTSSEKVQTYAANAYKTAGMSANEYMQTATSFSASLKQSFADTAEGLEAAANTTDMAITDMSDNANKMGTDIQRIQDAYQGFAKQNYTMLDNLKLGYGGTKTEMERLLADAEKLSGIKYDIGNLADVFNAIHVIQEELGITGTTAEEAATTIEGSFNMMKASFENFMTGMADENADIDTLLNNLVDSVITFGDNLLPRIETVFHNIGERIPDFAGIIISYLPKLVEKIAPAAIETFTEIINQLIDVAPEVLFSLFEAIGDAVPTLEPVTDLLSGLVENFDKLIPVIVACTSAVVTYKGAMIALSVIEQVTAWTKTANMALSAYTTAVSANANVSTLLASTLSPLQILYGLLKGKIDAATVSQLALNAAQKANVIMLVVSALAALVGGIIAYNIATDDAVTETERINSALADLEQQTQSNIKSINDNNTETLAEIAVTEQLFDRLIELDSELKNNSADTEENTQKKSELKGIVEQLNKVSPNFCLAVDNETGALANQIGVVQSLKTAYLELARAKAYADAYQQLMTENAKEQIELKTLADEATDIAIEKSKNYDIKKSASENTSITIYDKRSNSTIEKEDLINAEKEKDNAVKTARNAKSAYADSIERGNKIEAGYWEIVGTQTKAQENLDNLTKSLSVSGGNNSGGFTPSAATDNKKTTGNSKKGETQAEIDRRNLEHSYNMGEISADEFYQRLTVIRDKYYKDGSREYQQISEEIYDYGKEKTETAAKEAQKAREEQIETEHRNLKYAHDMGIISDKEYYVSLAQHRDAYFTEGSSQWQQYTLEIKGYFDNLQQEAIDKINEIEQEQERLTNRIKGENGLYTEVTKSFYDKNGKLDLQVKNIELTDYTKETEELTQYLDSINALSERVELPQAFFSEIRNLSTEEGAKFVNKLLSLSQGELEGYISSWDEYQKKTSEFSKEMYSGELEELESELKSKFGEIPEDFFGFGEESAEQYTDGFLEYLRGNWEQVTQRIQNALGSISLNPSVLWAESGNNGAVVVQNTTNFNTTVNSNSTTLSQELEEANRTNVNIAERSGY